MARLVFLTLSANVRQFITLIMIKGYIDLRLNIENMRSYQKHATQKFFNASQKHTLITCTYGLKQKSKSKKVCNILTQNSRSTIIKETQ